MVVPDLPGGMGPPPGLTKIAVKFPAYLVIGLSCGLIMLGTLQMRAITKLHHEPDGTKKHKQ